jgi:hypothetical protein
MIDDDADGEALVQKMMNNKTLARLERVQTFHVIHSSCSRRIKLCLDVFREFYLVFPYQTTSAAQKDGRVCAVNIVFFLWISATWTGEKSRRNPGRRVGGGLGSLSGL